jgi:hypothetical protein
VSRNIRLVLVVFCIVILLSAAIVVLDATERQQSSDTVVFRNSPPTDVRVVEISNEHGDILIDYMDGGYLVGNVPIDVVDMEKFVNMMTHSAALYAVTSIKNPGDLNKYGLDGDESSVYIQYADGQSINLSIGNAEPISKGYYCSIEGVEDVFLFEEERINAFLQPEKYYISNYVTPPIPKQSQSSLGHVLEVVFDGSMLDEPVRLMPVLKDDEQMMLDIISFGSATHLINLRGMNHRVDQRYAALVFDSLVGLTATDIVDYNLSEQEMKKFGFDSPDMQVEFDFLQAPGLQPVKYNVSLLEKNSVFYAAVDGRRVIYKIQPPLFYSIELEKFPVRWFFSPLLFDLSELEITSRGETYLFELSGSTNSDLAVKYNGKAFDLDRFRRLYKLVTSAAHDNTMGEKVTASGQEMMSITYRYRDKRKQEDTLMLYPAEARRHYAEVNGVTEFTIKEQFFTRVGQALDVLFTDEVFEIEW